MGSKKFRRDEDAVCVWPTRIVLSRKVRRTNIELLPTGGSFYIRQFNNDLSTNFRT